ncbi:GNAT family N-acetyltransferase [Streptomyces sp. NRRL B-24484]|uniref:GNAT family N-acetyltransferase n=1 Tax=Streptomyces sp. NRRL B-24484 TaxID=1463833 RepID=UPI00099751B2|nr:GNAT family N-acetyltransferase [Streptomyces sp. NRRL B-24484]
MTPPAAPAPAAPEPGERPAPPDGIADLGPIATPAGEFRLRPVRLPDDLPLIAGWMNDPSVDAWWSLAGPPGRTERHLRDQLDGDGRSLPCLGLLDGTPMSYWEIYRADLDPIAAHYPAEPHDTGLHLLLGPPAARGRGLGAVLLDALAAHVLAHRPACRRVLAEPDVRNTACRRSLERAGFRQDGELRLPDKTAALMVRPRARTRPLPAPRGGGEPYDLLGVGIGPFNLSLAALAHGAADAVSALFCEAEPEYRWHPGMLVEGARMQVPFLADLVSLVDPTSPWSFLNYLRHQERLFPFYFAERFQLSRREYAHYCRWVAHRLPNCRFGAPVTALRWDTDERLFRAEAGGEEIRARNVVLGVGTRPHRPAAFADLAGHPRVWHSADYLARRASLDGARDITVLGSGQSGAEVFLDLLRHRADDGTRLRWLSRTRALAPMEYSKLGLEHFTPDYTRYFHSLPREVRDRLVPAQWQLHKAASAETLAEIHDLLYERSVGRPPGGDPVEIVPGTAVTAARTGPCGGLELHCRHSDSGADHTLRTDAVVLATGYRATRPDALDPIADLIDWDEQGRYRVDLDHRVATRPGLTGGLYVQNAELHTHGVGTPDLGLGAHRAAVILNAVAGKELHPLPARTAWTSFAPPGGV